MYEDKGFKARSAARISSLRRRCGVLCRRGFQNEPQRCKKCRDNRKNSGKPQRELYTTVCARCGKEAKVPFQPSNDRPVYCSECYAAIKQN